MGEVATASQLATLLPTASVRHDVSIPGSAANIDHLVTTADGRLIVLDTKNWAAPGDMERATRTLKWEAERGAALCGAARAEPVMVMQGYYDGPSCVHGVRILRSNELHSL